MERKPDSIRAIVLVFAVGLVITGFTSLQASEEERSGARASTRAAADDIALMSLARSDAR
ncbi:hypothetical protein DYI22_07145 [Marinobacter lipolyticus]|uniref:hypothetical protein n=1 Tax=Marinobacter lipolyticus TaxID=209639 RepID=UPI001BCBE23E|nr:hypothetical protein [Marinobacter lipolyticus]MBS8240278.1 hypothetical protein [Marinobacter lipolyticus]